MHLAGMIAFYLRERGGRVEVGGLGREGHGERKGEKLALGRRSVGLR